MQYSAEEYFVINTANILDLNFYHTKYTLRIIAKIIFELIYVKLGNLDEGRGIVSKRTVSSDKRMADFIYLSFRNKLVSTRLIEVKKFD